MKKLLPIILSSVFMFGCSHTDIANQNKTMKPWNEVGQHCALDGVMLMSKADLNAMMPNHPISDTEYAEYVQGYKQGQVEYCQTDKAYKYGVEGRNYVGQCEGLANEEDFKAEWKRGYEEYTFLFFYE